MTERSTPYNPSTPLINPIHSTPPLVSIIIPCFNQGRFLAQAVESVLQQTWLRCEIIVVDDGSTDNTRQVATQFPQVQYVYQPNQGLSAARNTGLQRSQGEYLAFLDADDWFYPDGIEVNLRQLQQNSQAAFVSGAHDKVDSSGHLLAREQMPVGQGHYWRLLQSNYIGMHATVLYRRSLFDQFQFDPSLKACEDYDLYLRIARHHPVLHHTHPIAAYRIHGGNMSANAPLMLDRVLFVLARQVSALRSRQERKAYRRGVINWRDYYGTLVFESLLAQPAGAIPQQMKKPALNMLRKYNLSLYLSYWLLQRLPQSKRLFLRALLGGLSR
ncbi:glycosyltransferase [Spirosoma pulveris]